MRARCAAGLRYSGRRQDGNGHAHRPSDPLVHHELGARTARPDRIGRSFRTRGVRVQRPGHRPVSARGDGMGRPTHRERRCGNRQICDTGRLHNGISGGHPGAARPRRPHRLRRPAGPKHGTERHVDRGGTRRRVDRRQGRDPGRRRHVRPRTDIVRDLLPADGGGNFRRRTHSRNRPRRRHLDNTTQVERK